MFHVYSLTTCLLAGVMSAAELILLTRFNPDQMLETIRETSPTIFPVVPAICESICEQIGAGGASKPLQGLRLCFSGARAAFPRKPSSGLKSLPARPWWKATA